MLGLVQHNGQHLFLWKMWALWFCAHSAVLHSYLHRVHHSTLCSQFMVLFLMSEVCSYVNLLIYLGHHLSEVQNDHGDTTSLGSAHCISCCGGHASSLLTDLSSYAAGECRTKDLGWRAPSIPTVTNEVLLSENMTYPQPVGSCPNICRMSTQMEDPIIEIWHC